MDHLQWNLEVKSHSHKEAGTEVDSLKHHKQIKEKEGKSKKLKHLFPAEAEKNKEQKQLVLPESKKSEKQKENLRTLWKEVETATSWVGNKDVARETEVPNC